MARLLSPSPDAIGTPPYDLTETERQVLRFFRKRLSDGWEMFVRPHLNGLRPDLVLINPQVGIGAFLIEDGDTWPMARAGKSLLSRAEAYKDEILEFYCPRLRIKAIDHRNFVALVSAGVIVTHASTEDARRMVAPDRDWTRPLKGACRYSPVAGIDAIDKHDLATVFPEGSRTRSKYMNERFALDLKTWLIEPDHLADKREALRLDADQRRLVTSRTSTGYRRIKGPAGSGKSLVLAARTAELARQGKKVLVVCYNITLWHYLRELAKRYPDPISARTTEITWLHFHDWCKRVCQDAGLEGEYRAIWKSYDAVQRTRSDAAAEALTDVLERRIPALAARAVASGGDRLARYDAILVDEGQDFNLEWWNLLRSVLRPDGEVEAVLVADETQDIYSKANAWTDERNMPGAGFTGEWARLRTSYRLPNQLIPHIRRYVEMHLSDHPAILPEPDSTWREPASVVLHWRQIMPYQAVGICSHAVLNTPGALDPDPFSLFDVTLLTNSHAIGLQCMESLSRVVEVSHVFALDRWEQRNLKLNFFLSDTHVHGCTIHSFKGWESRSLVVYIDTASTYEARALLYVAMTRLKRHPQGNVLTVVCSAPELEAYGRTWPDFQMLAPLYPTADHARFPLPLPRVAEHRATTWRG